MTMIQIVLAALLYVVLFAVRRLIKDLSQQELYGSRINKICLYNRMFSVLEKFSLVVYER